MPSLNNISQCILYIIRAELQERVLCCWSGPPLSNELIGCVNHFVGYVLLLAISMAFSCLCGMSAAAV